MSGILPLGNKTDRSSRNPATVLEADAGVQSIEILGRDSDNAIFTHRNSDARLQNPNLMDQINQTVLEYEESSQANGHLSELAQARQQ